MENFRRCAECNYMEQELKGEKKNKNLNTLCIGVEEMEEKK
jgi:hypothetical protein